MQSDLYRNDIVARPKVMINMKTDRSAVRILAEIEGRPLEENNSGYKFWAVLKLWCLSALAIGRRDI